MALILNIETTTDNCSVTLAKDGELLNIAEQREGRLHASLLTTFIERVIKESGNSFDMLDAVGISKGPGSYTGLRIGVSAAKGICYALDIPLLAVHTLQAMNEQVVNNRQKYGLHKGETNLSFIPMIDARRMEVYSAVFNIENEFERDVEAEVLDENSYSELLKNSKAVFFGNGAGKFQEIPLSNGDSEYSLQFALGAGIHFRKLSIDYALTSPGNSNNFYSHVFSLRYSFDLDDEPKSDARL